MRQVIGHALVLLLLSMPIASRISIVEERRRFEGEDNRPRLPFQRELQLCRVAARHRAGHGSSEIRRCYEPQRQPQSPCAASHSPPQLTSHDLLFPACILPQLTESAQAPPRWTMLVVSLIMWIG